MSALKLAADEELRPFFTPRTLARYLALSDRSMRRLLADRVIPSYKVAGSRRIDPKDVEAFLRARRDG